MISLLQALMLDKGGVVSLVGAGGKTTLMFRLAHELAAAGESVLTTTTTKIFFPSFEQSACVILSAAAETIIAQAENLLADKLHFTAAAGGPRGQEKLLGLAPETIDTLWHSTLFRWILVEADGAARKPLKAPAPHEPVIPGSTTRLVGVLGLSAVNKPMTEQWVHRPELFAQVTGVDHGNPITEVALCKVLTSASGIFKGAPEGAVRLAFLNQADSPGARCSGRKVIELLAQGNPSGLRRVVMGCARGEPAVVEWIDLEI
jgi:probable selenium-dependent hydroxylase accessory protein YqeC